MTVDASLPSGTVTFMASDLAGSTAMFENEPTKTRELVLAHIALMRRVVSESGGVVFKTVGDGVWAAFQSAPLAVKCAREAMEEHGNDDRLCATGLKVALFTGDAKPIGGDYLERVVNRCSRLCAICEPGQIIIGASTHELVKQDFPTRYLGKRELRGLPIQHLWEVSDAIGEAAPTLPLAGVASQIPLPDHGFIGRRKELADLAEMLRRDSVRLVTIGGFGGLGKTTLAKATGIALGADFDEVCFVECESIANADELIAGIAHATAPDLVFENLQENCHYLRDHSTLIILDCFENLVDTRSVLEEIMESTAQVKILATSRRLIGLSREYDFPLGPMSGSPEAVGDAERLFWESAARSAHHLRTTRRNHTVALQIVQALECIPLAIVLAASRLRSVSPDELLDQIHQRRLKVLKRPSAPADDRHQNLLRVIDDSFSLLSDLERAMMRDLSVFHGFYREDALAVLGDEDVVDDGLASLRDNSLIEATTVGTRTKYRILDTIREYIALASADAPPSDTQRRHAGYFAEKAAAARHQVLAEDWKAGNVQLRQDLPNLRAAMRYAVQIQDTALLLDLVMALARPFAESNYRSEFDELITAAKQLLDPHDAELWIELIGLQGIIARREGRWSDALDLWNQRVELCRSNGTAGQEADSLADVCDLATSLGDLEVAEESLARFDKLCPSTSSDQAQYACGRILRARLALAQGDSGTALEMAGQAMAISEHLRLDQNMIYVGGQVALLLEELGQHDRFEEMIWKALGLTAEGHYPSTAAWLLLHMAERAARQRDAQEEAYFLALLHQLPQVLPTPIRSRIRKAVIDHKGRVGVRELDRQIAVNGDFAWNDLIQDAAAAKAFESKMQDF